MTRQLAKVLPVLVDHSSIYLLTYLLDGGGAVGLLSLAGN